MILVLGNTSNKNDMEVFIVTHRQMDIHCPIVVLISRTPEGARHYVDESIKRDLEPNPYRGMTHEYKCESIDNAEYSMHWYYFSHQESKLLYTAYNQHHQGYAILAVKLKH